MTSMAAWRLAVIVAMKQPTRCLNRREALRGVRISIDCHGRIVATLPYGFLRLVGPDTTSRLAAVASEATRVSNELLDSTRSDSGH